MSARPDTQALASKLDQPTTTHLSSGLIFLMASSVGLAVASLYYAQPLLGLLLDAGLASNAEISWIPTLTQIGYALGIFFLAPLGDRYNRKLIILSKGIILCLALLLMASSRQLTSLLMASLLIGISATLAQDLVPAAASLAPANQRGKVVGTVMTGLLLGILLSRVVSGVVAHYAGWPTVFYLAAAGIAISLIALHQRLPDFAASSDLSYSRLLLSTLNLLKQHRPLVLAAATQGLLQIGFSAFWSSLALLLQSPGYQLNSMIAGAFGLAGAAGALAAPWAGKYADRLGPVRIARIGCWLTAASFLVMLAADFSSLPLAILILIITAIGFDMGVQIALIAHQTLIYSLDPEARSRLNAILLSAMFIGMALGSSLGGYLLGRFGNQALPALGLVAALLACVLRSLKQRRTD